MRWGDPGFSQVLLGMGFGLWTLLWGVLIAAVGQWGRAWRLKPSASTGDLPLLSICIPARNEVGNIGACLQAVLASDHPNLEIIVVDDGSDDGTAAAAQEAGGGHPRFRLIQGTAPPPGWAGKPWACQRAAGEAAGDFLLFLDADVRLAPWTARAAMEQMESRPLDLLSLFGNWDLRGFWEVALVPVVGWFIRGSVDLEAANKTVSPVAFANGQFILARRSAYDALGGHGAVKSEVLEDVHLARVFKQRALSCGLLHAPGAFSVRLYDSLGAIIEGYSKNLYEGMGRRPAVALSAIGFIFLGTLFPFLALIGVLLCRWLLGWQLLGPGWILWLLGICLLVPLFRWRLEREDGRSGWHALTHPLGNLVFIWILLRSMGSMEARWKGRTFLDGRAQ
jgi:chlorobactene glucosyltransferase